MSTDLERSLIYFGCLVVAVILHEVSHGIVALWFGDRTAKEAGRLTLNPVPHIDPVGSVFLPAMGALLGVPVIAWAKPVPVNPTRLRHPRRDMLYVSLAGPATNFVLMALAAVAARAAFDPSQLPPFNATIDDLPLDVRILFQFAFVNLFLGLFNLLPIPPLDGSALIERVLPGNWLPHWYRFRPYGMLVLFLLVFSTGVLTTFIRPFENRLLEFIFIPARATSRHDSSGRCHPPRLALEDVEWVETILTPDAFEMWQRQPNHDRRHLIEVARGVQAELAKTPYADDPRWLACALLHDVGKLDARLGVYGRVVAIVAGAVGGREMADAWSERSGFTRRVGLYLRHAELGGVRIRVAGGPEEAARWAEVHHENPSVRPAGLGVPEAVVAALDACDND